MFRIICLLLLMFGSVGYASSQSKYPPIEKLVYDGYYNWGMIWIKAGRVEFSLSPCKKYPNANKLEAIGISIPSWDWVFKVRDTLTSIYDAETFLPYEFSRKAHEANYHKTFDYKFNYADTLIIGDIHRIDRYRRSDTLKLLPDTYDMLSVAWMTRELEFDKYKKNELIPIRVLIDSKIYDLHIRYLGVDKVKVMGHKKECYVFSPLLVEGKIFRGGEGMKIWVSNDKYRLPVQVEAKILIGSVKAILVPGESKVVVQ